MTTAADATDNQIIQCPNCSKSITVDELGEHVNANPEIKKEAIERELLKSHPLHLFFLCKLCSLYRQAKF